VTVFPGWVITSGGAVTVSGGDVTVVPGPTLVIRDVLGVVEIQKLTSLYNCGWDRHNLVG
jgi:hypothetical protein